MIYECRLRLFATLQQRLSHWKTRIRSLVQCNQLYCESISILCLTTFSSLLKKRNWVMTPRTYAMIDNLMRYNDVSLVSTDRDAGILGRQFKRNVSADTRFCLSCFGLQLPFKYTVKRPVFWFGCCVYIDWYLPWIPFDNEALYIQPGHNRVS